MSMESQALVDQLRTLGIWPDDEFEQAELLLLQRDLPDARSLSRELMDRQVLTPYQANQILTGKGQNLAVGPYRIVERLGEGAMAQVFKARHYILHRIVALKVIRRERLANPVAVERFLREAEAAAQLSHPNVVRAYDADQANGAYYFAMQFVDGIDLARLIDREGPLAVERAGNYIQQAALGLQHIHEHGMAHRDIKPSNLMVTRLSYEPAGNGSDGSTATVAYHGPATPWGVVKVLDLGLARLAEDPGAASQREVLTKLGTVMGTPDYMAPEQALHSRNADIRSDLYSLGCTLYYLLAARPPFPDGDAVAKMLKHQLDEPTPIETLRQDVPESVRSVLKKLMAKKPEDRFPTPRDAAEALRSALDERPPLAVPVRPPVDPEAATILASPPPAPDTGSFSGIGEESAFAAADTSQMIVSPPPAPPIEWSLWIVLGCAGVIAVLGILGALFAIFR
jgi:serine/threonine-protein kinase